MIKLLLRHETFELDIASKIIFSLWHNCIDKLYRARLGISFF